MINTLTENGWNHMANVNADLFELHRFIEKKTGFVIQDTGHSKLNRSIVKRMAASGQNSLNAYLKMLDNSSFSELELPKLMSSVFNHHTYFMRDISQLTCFIQDCLPEYLYQKGSNHTLRIWSAGCSTGEEPYSLAILLHDALQDTKQFSILASDIDQASINAAITGWYDKSLGQRIPNTYLNRYFTEYDGGLSVKKSLKDMITFKNINLLDQRHIEEIGTFDFIFCRNVLFYFEGENQKSVMSSLYSVLNDGGFLFLSTSERPSALSSSLKLRKFDSHYAYQKGPQITLTSELKKLTVDPEYKALEIARFQSICFKKDQISHPSGKRASMPGSPVFKRQELIDISLLVKERSGILLSRSHYETMKKVLLQRMIATRSFSSSKYLELLFYQNDSLELSHFIHLLLSEETEFFHDFQQLEYFAEICLPIIEKQKMSKGEKRVRVWVVGCSSGKEAYTLAMIMEAMLADNSGFDYQISASGYDLISLQAAAEGQFNAFESGSIPVEYLEDYFNRTESGYQITDSIRKKVFFEHLNFTDDDNFSKRPRYDIIFCRNILQFLARDVQVKTLNFFHRALNSQGYLFLDSDFHLNNGSADLSLEQVGSAYRRYF